MEKHQNPRTILVWLEFKSYGLPHGLAPHTVLVESGIVIEKEGWNKERPRRKKKYEGSLRRDRKKELRELKLAAGLP